MCSALCVLPRSCLTLCDPMGCRLLCAWDFPGKNTGVGSHFLFQGIFPTQGSNTCLLHWQEIFFFTTEPTEKPVFPLTFSISAIALRRSCLTGVLLPGTEWVTSGEKPSHPRPTQPRLDQPGWPWDTWARQMLVFLLLSLGGSLLCNNIWTLEVMCSICSGQISFLATRGC